MRQSDTHWEIPRDPFNWAKLLKCFGQLCLKVHDGMVPDHLNIEIEFEHYGHPFKVEQLEDGDLTIVNYPITINGEDVTFVTTYNSKDAYPYYCWTQDGESYLVFDDKGEFTDEFLNIQLNGTDTSID